MYTIRKAEKCDAKAIKKITGQAFILYRDELHSSAPVYALTETQEDIVRDITTNNVFIAEENGQILGAVRYCDLGGGLAYLYRFAVDPEINNTGIGSDLLGAIVSDCRQKNFSAIALHTNSKYYKLARYYYGKEFFVHSTDQSKGYIRALFIKELNPDATYDISPAFLK